MTLPWIIVSVYFVIGGIATAVINKKKPQGAKQRWVKYAVYLIIVFAMLELIKLDLFLYAALIITAIGFYEVIRIGRGKTRRIGVVIYTLIALSFLIFVNHNREILSLLYITVLTFDGF